MCSLAFGCSVMKIVCFEGKKRKEKKMRERERENKGKKQRNQADFLYSVCYIFLG